MKTLTCNIENHPELSFEVDLAPASDSKLIDGLLKKISKFGLECYLEHDVLAGDVFYVPARIYSLPSEAEKYQPAEAGMVFLNEAYNQIGFIYGETTIRKNIPIIGKAPVETLKTIGKTLWQEANAAYKPELFKLKVELN